MISLLRTGHSILIVVASESCRPVNIVTRYECQSSIFRSAGNIPLMKRSTDGLPSSIFMAKYDATTNLTCVRKSPRRRCRITKLSSAKCCFVAKQIEEGLLSFMRLAQLWEIVSARTAFMAAPVARRQIYVCIIVVEILFNTQGLYVGLDVSVTSVGVGANSRDSGRSVTFRFELIVNARS